MLRFVRVFFNFQFPENAAALTASLNHSSSLPRYKRLLCGTDSVRERRPGNIKRASHLQRDKPGLL